MKRSQNRVLTTHTGSLPRPAALAEMLIRKNCGQAYDKGELAKLARDAVKDTVRRQAEIGIDIPNDGEQSRTSFFLYVTHRMSGFGGTWSRPRPTSSAKYPEFVRMQDEIRKGQARVQQTVGIPMVVEPLKYIGFDELKAEIADLSDALEGSVPFADQFITAASPGIIATALKNNHYASNAEYLDALSEAMRIEYEAIIKAGFVLQIDSPDLAYDRSAVFGDKPLSEFIDFAELVVGSINRALRNIPRELVRLHVCWGNSDAPHDDDVELSAILPTLLRANVGALVLPFATGRQAHEYKVFQRTKLPRDMLLVAGVVDTRVNVIEHPETVADRIERIAAAIGDPTRLIAGTDCGLSTAAGQGSLASDVAWAKLSALASGAKLASARLF